VRHPGPADERIAPAERILYEAGLPAVRVQVAGHENEVALLRVAAADRARVAAGVDGELSRRIKALGFRYVALELGARDPE
jgi:PP-loop superfamily ATP-utilizing enzyme